MQPERRLELLKIASADDVRAACADRINLQSSVEPDDFDPDGWRLHIVFERNGERFGFAGRMFRAPSQEIARTRAAHQLKRMLGVPTRLAEKFSNDFVAARTALEAKIRRVWELCPPTASDLIKPGPIKVNWSRREPLLKVMRFTSFETLQQRYDPELAQFTEISKRELAPRAE